MVELKPGDPVLYSPDLIHATHTDILGRYHFHYVHHTSSGPYRAGDAADMSALGTVQERLKDDAGRPLANCLLRMSSGHLVRPARPHSYWKATVVRVNADGSLDLDIAHPNGYATHHCPDRELHPNAPGVPHDANKRPHSWHLPGE